MKRCYSPTQLGGLLASQCVQVILFISEYMVLPPSSFAGDSTLLRVYSLCPKIIALVDFCASRLTIRLI
jgi:hypothetical protein